METASSVRRSMEEREGVGFFFLDGGLAAPVEVVMGPDSGGGASVLALRFLEATEVGAPLVSALVSVGSGVGGPTSFLTTRFSRLDVLAGVVAVDLGSSSAVSGLPSVSVTPGVVG